MPTRQKQKSCKSLSFTLIELLVVIAIIVILFSSKYPKILLIFAYGGIGPFWCPYV